MWAVCYTKDLFLKVGKNQLHPALQLSSLKLPPFNYLIIKQEGHGPHRSPEKSVQINKHIGFIITLILVWLELAQWF